MDNRFLLLADVARLLNRKPYQIIYLLTSRQVPEPSLRIGNRRVFQQEDIQRLAERLNLESPVTFDDDTTKHGDRI